MDRRRTLLLALAGVAAAPAYAFAQTHNAAIAAAIPSPPSNVGPAELKQIIDTLQVGTLSLEISRHAISRASDPRVKRFASFEVAEQETIAGIMKPMAGGEIPIDPEQVGVITKLQQAANKFDEVYVDAELRIHQRLLQIQQAYLSKGKNQLNLDIAKLASTMINEHLRLLEDMQKSGLKG